MDFSDWESAYEKQFNTKSSKNMPMDTADVLSKASQVEKAIPGEIGKLLKALGLGSLQGVGSNAASLANLPAHLIGSDKRIPHPNLSQYVDPEYLLPFYGAEIAGPGLGKFAAIQKLNSIARPTGKLGLASDIGRGFGVGYALGENPEGENSLLSGRPLGGALQAAFSPAGSILRDAPKAERISKREKAIRSGNRAQYRGVEKESDIANIIHPELQFGRELSQSPDFKKSIERYQRNPTHSNAHLLQSDAGKFARKVEKQGYGGYVPSHRNEAMMQARDLKNKVNENIEMLFAEHGRPDLAKRYFGAGENYERNVRPWLKPSIQEPLREYRRGFIGPERFVKDMKGSQSFNRRLAQDFPEIAFKDALINAMKSTAKYGIAGSAAGGTGFGLYKAFGGD